jgi:membrane associated rhomboid family serine protease
MRPAAVGQQCLDCVYAAAHSVPQPQYQPQAFPQPQAQNQRQRKERRTIMSPTSAVSFGLIVANVAVFVLELVFPSLKFQLAIVTPWVASGGYYRLFTSAFVHYGLMHLLFNMWAIYVIGPPLEQVLGRLRFGGLYLVSALGGSVLVYLLGPLNMPTAGASGAVFGLFGATFVVARRLNLDVKWVVGLIAINLIFTFAAPAVIGQAISWQGHVGGLITGTAITAAYIYAPRAHRNGVAIGVTVGALALLGAITYWRTASLWAAYGYILGS